MIILGMKVETFDLIASIGKDAAKDIFLNRREISLEEKGMVIDYLTKVENKKRAILLRSLKGSDFEVFEIEESPVHISTPGLIPIDNLED